MYEATKNRTKFQGSYPVIIIVENGEMKTIVNSIRILKELSYECHCIERGEMKAKVDLNNLHTPNELCNDRRYVGNSGLNYQQEEVKIYAYNKTSNMSGVTRYCQGSGHHAALSTVRYASRPAVTLSGDVELNPGPATLSVYHCNARSLRKQLRRLRSLASLLEGIDVIAFTETWLTGRVADSELQQAFGHHTWFRRDRGWRGGGVACAVRSSLRPRLLPSPPGVEMLLVHLDELGVTIAVCYRPPKDDAALREIMDHLQNKTNNTVPLVVVGDFNIPEIAWLRTNEAASPILLRRTRRAKCFINTCQQMHLQQWVSEPTRGENVLDLVLTRNLECYASVQESLFKTDHKETVAHINFS